MLVGMDIYATRPLRSLLSLQGTEGPTGVWDFEEDIRLAFAGHPHLTDGAKIDIIWNSLGPLPRAELRCHGPDVLQNPDALLNALHRTFGDRRSLRELFTDLVGTTQKPGQSILSFSHQVHASWSTLNRAQERKGDAPLPESQLCDVFLEGLIDPMTLRMTRHHRASHPDLPFLRVRDVALIWESDSAAAPAVSPPVLTVPPPTPTRVPSSVMTQTVDPPRNSQLSPIPSKDKKGLESKCSPSRRLRRKRKIPLPLPLLALMDLSIETPVNPNIRDCLTLAVYNDCNDLPVRPEEEYEQTKLLQLPDPPICPPPPNFKDNIVKNPFTLPSGRRQEIFV